MNTLIPIFSNRFKAQSAGMFEACCQRAHLSGPVSTLLFSTVPDHKNQVYLLPIVIGGTAAMIQ